MKFSQIIKNQTVNYRLCDELTCKQIAMHVLVDDSIPKRLGPAFANSEYHLCETHYLRYKAELKDEVSSNERA